MPGFEVPEFRPPGHEPQGDESASTGGTLSATAAKRGVTIPGVPDAFNRVEAEAGDLKAGAEVGFNIVNPKARIGSTQSTGATGSASAGTAGPSLRVAGLAAAKAPKIGKVEVAVLRVRKGLRPLASLAKKKAKPACEWLKDKKSRFKRVKPTGKKKVCDRPVWLRAKGTRKWKISWKRLPPGTYLYYPRATTADGAPQLTFSSKDKSRVKVKVR